MQKGDFNPQWSVEPGEVVVPLMSTGIEHHPDFQPKPKRYEARDAETVEKREENKDTASNGFDASGVSRVTVQSGDEVYHDVKAAEEEKPRRYEVRDAETGEKLSGVSFILTPTGEEMHLLSGKRRVGPLEVAAYYTGNPKDGIGTRRSEIYPDMARYDLASCLLGKVGPHYLEMLRRQIDRRMEREANGSDENPSA